MRALVSVSDKTGVVALAQTMHGCGIELVSTGGTAEVLRSGGVPVTDVAALTRYPEIMDGRVKTLHPAIHGGVLARPDHAEDAATLEALGFGLIDYVVVNLYPFAATLAKGAERDELIETIDIGGPALLRAGAKTHQRVLVVCDPGDYPQVERCVRAGGSTEGFRRTLAAKAFAHTAAYDGQIAQWLAGVEAEEGTLPEVITLTLQKRQTLRYGENPHQRAGVYVGGEAAGVVGAQRLQGEISYNNLLDGDCAWRLALDVALAAGEGQQSVACIVKHGSPCGVATGAGGLEAFEKAWGGDPVSAFGGIVALSTPVELELAQALTRQFCELVIAPNFTEEALVVLQSKPRLRILKASDGGAVSPFMAVRSLWGGYMLQDDGGPTEIPEQASTVTTQRPTPQQHQDLALAWRVVRMVHSNAIVLVRQGQTIGIGGGQTNRKAAVDQAIQHAEAFHQGAHDAVLASDAFFPFPDALETALKAGVKAVIHPGGSVKDASIIACAEAQGVAMVLTRCRLFRH